MFRLLLEHEVNFKIRNSNNPTVLDAAIANVLKEEKVKEDYPSNLILLIIYFNSVLVVYAQY